ncbi:MAG: hypothetical protein MJ252_06950 [archaeon]|nr:hypothetical protein [archaeon]
MNPDTKNKHNSPADKHRGHSSPENSYDSSSPSNIQLIKKYSESYENFQEFYDTIHTKRTLTQLKFNDVIYNIGDTIRIYGDNDEELVATLERIIPNNGDPNITEWPTIEVKWFYKKDDINLKKNGINNKKDINCLSEYELFNSTHKDIIFIENIIGKCKVYTLEEFEKLEDIDDQSYFSRASYDSTSQLLTPRFSKWKRTCTCHTPLNPEQFYIICDSCNKFFHPECLGMKEEDVKKIDKFYCPKCKRSR